MAGEREKKDIPQCQALHVGAGTPRPEAEANHKRKGRGKKRRGDVGISTDFELVWQLTGAAHLPAAGRKPRRVCSAAHS